MTEGREDAKCGIVDNAHSFNGIVIGHMLFFTNASYNEAVVSRDEIYFEGRYGSMGSAPIVPRKDSR
jgi:hypothetical protein